jgi:proline iminopeptidase
MADQYTYDEGSLDVGDGHHIFFEDWGSRTATPIFFMHGGPGGGCDEDDKKHFDPTKQRIIFHDQRGAGKSTPYAATEANTTAHLIKDIEKIREYLKVESMHVCGGSWGSTLSLLYAIAHAERVVSLTISSIFLGTAFELDFVNEGYARVFLPREWERFIALVPAAERTNGTTIMQYYAATMRSSDKELSERYAREWTLWESSLCSINFNAEKLEASIWNSSSTRAIALIETHYFMNNCFIPEGYIISSIEKIQHIPCTILQGRFDFCTPAISAQKLADAYSKNATLTFLNASHSTNDPGFSVALHAALAKLK